MNLLCMKFEFRGFIIYESIYNSSTNLRQYKNMCMGKLYCKHLMWLIIDFSNTCLFKQRVNKVPTMCLPCVNVLTHNMKRCQQRAKVLTTYWQCVNLSLISPCCQSFRFIQEKYLITIKEGCKNLVLCEFILIEMLNTC